MLAGLELCLRAEQSWQSLWSQLYCILSLGEVSKQKWDQSQILFFSGITFNSWLSQDTMLWLRTRTVNIRGFPKE